MVATKGRAMGTLGEGTRGAIGRNRTGRTWLAAHPERCPAQQGFNYYASIFVIKLFSDGDLVL
jgi:hypothetical protein